MRIFGNIFRPFSQKSYTYTIVLIVKNILIEDLILIGGAFRGAQNYRRKRRLTIVRDVNNMNISDVKSADVRGR